MNKEFIKAMYTSKVDWLSWLGMPLVYDGGLCVNRTLEEHQESDAMFNEVRIKPLSI